MKRLTDLIISTLVIVLFFPIFAVVATMVLCTAGRPVFFIQQRPGLAGKPFPLVKFKSMNDARDEAGNLLPSRQRVTRFGKLIRSTSLDELPQLINVVKGEMSLVGPRPLRMKYLPLYTAEQMRRHDVKPGITGWAQINGRTDLSWEDTFELDVWYVDNQSWWLDMRILWLTFIKVIKREGVNSSGETFRHAFKGSGK